MPSAGDRGPALAAFDARSRAFIDHCRAEAPAGYALGRADLEILWNLANHTALAVAAWRPVVATLDLARLSPLDLNRATVLIAESVFDEVLTPLAYGAFRAALDLAVQGQ